jgi:hypothetical protein
MKTFVFRAAFALFSLTLLLAGCTSPSGGGALTLKETRMNVDWKMVAYQEAVTAGNVTQALQQRVSATHQAYQAAFRQALADAKGNLRAPTPAQLGQLATQLIGMIDALL